MRRLLCVLLFLAASPLRAQVAGLGKGEEPPSLYELTARSDLVVAAKVFSGSLKRAQVIVREVFRGDARPEQRLEIAFRDFNNNLSKENRIAFTDGESEILFLVPELNSAGRPRGNGRYTLFRGRFGRFTLPREGEEIYLEAMREFAELVSLKDHRELFHRLRGLLNSPNPILVNVGLREVLKLDLMEKGMAPVVMGFYRDPSPARRISALNLMERLFTSLPDRGDSPEFQETTLPPVMVLARNDPDERVRVAAVKALGAWGGEAVVETLREVAEQDAAQSVRYEAQLILLRSGGDASGPRKEKRP